ncbi:MAG TPA: hypothetical protein VHM70_25435 [Polyangiaceae bacterium]|nr:hypothetical protein [Polyangiaceae bacterium]
MKHRRVLALTSPLLAALSVAAACSSEDPADTSSTLPFVTASASDSGSTAVPPASTPVTPVQTLPMPAVPTVVTPATLPTPITPAGPPAVSSSVAPMTVPTPSTTSSSAGMSACTDTTYDASNTDNSVTAFSGADSIYFFGDGATTACGTATAGQMCMTGQAGPAGADSAHWGAGMGILLATDAGPFNATAQGITQVKLHLSNVMGRPVQFQITQVDDPAITDTSLNYEANGFVWGGGSPMQKSADGDVILPLSEFKLPSWTKVANGADQVLDASKMHSLQIQVSNSSDAADASYNVCVSAVQWLDMAGAPVTPMATPAPSSTSTAPAPSGSGGGGNEPAPETGGMNGVGGAGGTDSDALFDAAHEVLQAKCASCHSMSFGSSDRATSLMSSTKESMQLKDRVTRPTTQQGHMPQGGMLSDDEIKAITDWVDSL